MAEWKDPGHTVSWTAQGFSYIFVSISCVTSEKFLSLSGLQMSFLICKMMRVANDLEGLSWLRDSTMARRCFL